jgi:hypothetical protein
MSIKSVRLDELAEELERERDEAEYKLWSLDVLLLHYLTVANEHYGLLDKREKQSWHDLHLEFRALQDELHRRLGAVK